MWMSKRILRQLAIGRRVKPTVNLSVRHQCWSDVKYEIPRQWILVGTELLYKLLDGQHHLQCN